MSLQETIHCRTTCPVNDQSRIMVFLRGHYAIQLVGVVNYETVPVCHTPNCSLSQCQLPKCQLPTHVNIAKRQCGKMSTPKISLPVMSYVATRVQINVPVHRNLQHRIESTTKQTLKVQFGILFSVLLPSDG